MKRTLFILVVLTFSTCAFAQFEKGTKYVGVNFSGLGASYSGSEKFRIGMGAQAGYFFMDALAAVATINWDKNVDGAPAYFSMGAEGRYYIRQNGIFLGAGFKYKHCGEGYNDFMPNVEVGYAFYINHYVTIEPAIYYEQSLKNHSDYSKIGLRISAGLYF